MYPSRLSRVEWLSLHQGRGGCRFVEGWVTVAVAAVVNPPASAYVVIGRYLSSLGPLIASAWWSSSRRRWAEFTGVGLHWGFITPPPCQLVLPAPWCFACLPPTRLTLTLLLLLVLGLPFLLPLVSPLLLLFLVVSPLLVSSSSSTTSTTSSSLPFSMAPHRSAISPLLLVASPLAPPHCFRLPGRCVTLWILLLSTSCRCLGPLRLPPSPDPPPSATNPPTSLWKGEGRMGPHPRF
jgi:hypothetical protein